MESIKIQGLSSWRSLNTVYSSGITNTKQPDKHSWETCISVYLRWVDSLQYFGYISYFLETAWQVLLYKRGLLFAFGIF